MTPKEKAEELVDKMYFSKRYKNQKNDIAKEAYIYAKQCALIAVNEILDNNCGTITDGQLAYMNELYCDDSFWYQVTKEIEDL